MGTAAVPCRRTPESEPEMGKGWASLLVLAVVWILLLLQRGQPLGWDEVEFFRATRWIGEGKVPFRDFWEHHTPLQWMLFAPVARLFSDGPGVASIVAMRWAQAVLWVFALTLAVRLSPRTGRWPALGLLLSAPLFVRPAIEYRVDMPGNLFYLAAVALVSVRVSRARWIGFGALMSLAVLANMRLAPLVILTAAILSLWRRDDRRWGFQALPLWMAGGVASVALPFVGWLASAGAWRPFLDGVIGYNVASSKLIDVQTRLDQFLAPIWLLDPAAIALWCAGLAGVVFTLRQFRRPALSEVLALLFVASLLAVAAMEVQYEYHFQTSYLLMVPLAAIALGRLPSRLQWIAPAAAVVALFVNLLPLLSTPWGAPMAYQDAVMREADRRTQPGDRIFEGTGYALRRTPAYRYWFLPTGLRFLAESGEVPPYDMKANPPAAIIYNLRLQRWFEIFPQTAAYAVTHYVPLYRDLWVPGMTMTLEPGASAVWSAPAGGSFTLWPSETLLRHPWVTSPLEYASIQGTRAAQYAIPLRQLPPARAVEWSVDGIPVRGLNVRLRKGSRVTIQSREPRRIGLLLVPSDIATLAIAPAEEFQF